MLIAARILGVFMVLSLVMMEVAVVCQGAR